MTTAPGDTLTLRQILMEPAADGSVPAAPPQEPGTGALGERLDGLPAALRAAAAEQIVTLVARVLDRRLVDVLAAGWRRWDELTGAALRTIEDPGQVEIVELVDHQISSVQRPHVDVTLDGAPVAEVAAEAAVEITLHAVTAVVAGGRLSALRSGRADVDARLVIEDVTVADSTRRIELPIEVALGDGIALVQGAEPVTVLPEPDA